MFPRADAAGGGGIVLERLVTWLMPNESSEVRARSVHRTRVVMAIIGYAAVILILLYARSHPRTWSTSGWDWVALVGGVFLAYFVALDIRSGRSSISAYGTRDDKNAYTRSADPVGYWILIAFKVAVAAGLVVGSLGDLLGLWNVR